MLLAVPATAAAKVGVEFQQDPQTAKPGEQQDFNVMVISEPRTPGGEPAPIVGRRPLVTFTNVKTGEVVRVRSGVTNSNGIGAASVTFPSRGEWKFAITGVRDLLDEGEQSVPIGIPISDTAGGRSLPPEVVNPPAPATSDEGRATWPVLPLAIGLAIAAMAAGAVILRRREASV